METHAILEWLLAGDPAIAWQAERDLLGLPAARYERTRRRVCQTGWGARLLERRADDGTWGRGLYNPKWTSTFYTLQLLGLLGAGAEEGACVQSCRLLLAEGVQDDGAVRLWRSGPPDACVTGMLLWMGVRFGLGGDACCQRMLAFLLDQQMPDGGWNCRWRRGPAPGGPTHGSFHTTTSVLEALQAWLADPARTDGLVVGAAAAGREFLLAHQLYRSHRTGAVARAAFTELRFPHWWKFDVLRGLDHFRAADAWDARLADPLRLLERRRGQDGRWKLPRPYPGPTWVELEGAGAPSRWNTLRAWRVLSWAARREAATLGPAPGR